MIFRSFLPLLAIAAGASAQEREAGDQPTIVVTATSIEDTGRRLRECLERRCPPGEDIDATLAHAENLFVAGDYDKARHIARRSIARNDRHARTHPVDVADLYRAYSRISAHLGEGEAYRQATFAMRRTLRKGLPEGDPRLLGADFEVAGMYAAMKELDRARRAYRGIEDKAIELGRPDLAANARVRAAWLHELAGDRHLVRKALGKLAEDMSPEARVARLTSLILLARLDRQEGRTESSAALIEALKGSTGSRPVLLFSPKIAIGPGVPAEGAGSTTRLMATQNYEDRWVDIGFWVTPEGRVSEAEILRSGSSAGWAQPLLRSIEGRIYSPPADPAGSYRVERYTFTAYWMSVTGSHIRQRSPESRIEFLDLTAE